MYDQRRRPEYVLLNPGSFDDTNEDEALSSAQYKYQSEGTIQSSTSFTISRPIFYASILLVILSILNGALLPFTLPRYKESLMTQHALDALPYPPQGIGLDRAAKIVPHLPTWSRSWPLSITRLSQKLKNAVYGDGVQVFISVEDSAIFRFRVPASKSNSKACALTWTAPPSLSARAGDLHTKGEISEIEVWSIISPNVLKSTYSKTLKDIDFDDLSWNTRPVRGELLGTLNMNAKLNSTTTEFGCPRDDDDLIIEMRCLRVACEVKFKQVHMVPKMGFELIRKD